MHRQHQERRLKQQWTSQSSNVALQLTSYIAVTLLPPSQNLSSSGQMLLSPLYFFFLFSLSTFSHVIDPHFSQMSTRGSIFKLNIVYTLKKNT